MRGDYGFHMVRQAGTALGKAALRRMDEWAAAKAEASLRVKENLVTIPHRTGSKTSQACVMTAMIGNELALVTIPGEPFIQHQLNLRNRSPVPNTFLLGMAYCGQGSPYLVYMPTAQAVKEGGYGASECSFVSGEAGDLMVDAAAAAIAELAEK